MSKRGNQKHPEGCAQPMVKATADPPGENDNENIPAMTQHEEAHLEEASYICSQCGKNLTSYSKFMKHQEMHNTVQNFMCTQCGKRYTNPAGLRLHQDIHTMKKVYTCAECKKCFVYSSHLMEHQKNHMCYDTGSVNEALKGKAQDPDTIQWSLEEKREIMYCHYYASALKSEVYIQLLRSKLEQRGIIPLVKLRCASDAKLRTVRYDVKRRQYISDAELELIKNAAEEEVAGERQKK